MTEILAVLAIGTLGMAFIAAVMSYRTRKDVLTLGKQIDGRLSDLLAITRKDALAEGRLAGQADPK